MSLYIPQNIFGITEGHYTNDGLASLLREHKGKSGVVQFIADMIEDGRDKNTSKPNKDTGKPKNYIQCWECHSKINIGDEFYVEKRESDGVEIPYCHWCYGRTLEENDEIIKTFWENHSEWAN